MKMLDKVDPKLVEAFCVALKGVATLVAIVIGIILGTAMIIAAFKASVILGFGAIIVMLLFGVTMFNYFD